MTIFVTSDLHFGHVNSIKFCPETRGRFSSAHEMNEYFIVEWNKQVAGNDTVYILGDMFFTNHDDALFILNKLNGKKILIEGNHDHI